MARGGDAGGRAGAAEALRGARRRRRAPRRQAGRGVGGRPLPGDRGLFITIEGLDFSGKSTLVGVLKETLAGSGLEVHFTREPGGTPAAERIREVLLDPSVEMDPWTEAYLYAAARADHTRREVLPRLARGEVVVCERYLDSSVAYQGYGRGLGAGTVRELNARAVAGAAPDRTFYLRLDEAERKRRAQGSGLPPDRIERVGAEFMRRVEAGFEEIARGEPERVMVLDATRPPWDLARTVRNEVLRLYTR